MDAVAPDTQAQASEAEMLIGVCPRCPYAWASRKNGICRPEGDIETSAQGNALGLQCSRKCARNGQKILRMKCFCPHGAKREHGTNTQGAALGFLIFGLSGRISRKNGICRPEGTLRHQPRATPWAAMLQKCARNGQKILRMKSVVISRPPHSKKMKKQTYIRVTVLLCYCVTV